MGWSFNASGSGLMLGSLAVLIIVGVIFNNLTNTGFTNTNAYAPPNCTASPTCGIVGGTTTCSSLNCPAFSSVQACNPATQCQLGLTSFLNQASPITALITGNFNQLASSMAFNSQANTGTNQPFEYFSNATATNNNTPNDTGTTVFAICGNINGTIWTGPNGGNGGNNIKLQCNHVYLNSTQVPTGLSKVFGNASGLTDSLNCTSWNSAITANPTAYVYYGCDSKYPNPSFAKYMIVTVNATVEKNAQGFGGVVDVYAWILLTDQRAAFHSGEDPTYCAWISAYGGPFVQTQPTPNCQSWASSVKATIGQSANGVFAGLLALGFIAGVIMLVIGLGIGLNIQAFATGFGLTPNAQGTRLLQVFGLALVTFIPFYSEFGTWLTPTVIGVFSPFATFILLITLFLGIYSQTTAGTAGA